MEEVKNKVLKVYLTLPSLRYKIVYINKGNTPQVIQFQGSNNDCEAA